jgi:hypothetical protein
MIHCARVGSKNKSRVITPDGADSMQLPSGVTDKETYTRETLSVGGAAITIYRHERLTPERVLNRLVEHYKAWAVNQPGGRR